MKVQIVQNKTSDRTLSLIHQLAEARAEVKTIHEFAEELPLQFRKRIVDLPNSLIDSLSKVTQSSLDRRHSFNIIR